MPEISQRALEFAQGRFTDFMENLLDDPSDLLHPYRDKEPAEEIAELRALAADLGLDYDALVAKGHDHERERLADVESGGVAADAAPTLPLVDKDINPAVVYRSLMEYFVNSLGLVPYKHAFELNREDINRLFRYDSSVFGYEPVSELREWLQENCQSPYSVVARREDGYVQFVDETDAFGFRLRWS